MIDGNELELDPEEDSLFEEGEDEDDGNVVATRNATIAAKEQLAHITKVFEIMVKWLEMDPIKRNRPIVMAKAFFRWAKIFPVNLKCDELAKQLQERSLSLTTFRDAYLKDVISVKYYLDKIAQIKLPDGKPEIGIDMYDLHTIPSVDLRCLIDKALQSQNATSLQLRETLLQAGLVNASGKDLNPWEKSRSYRKALKNRFGNDSSISREAKSLTLFAPKSHRLFVRYCTDCVGFMNFVRDWDREVEEALALKLEGKAMLAQLNNLRVVINTQNDVIAKQELSLHEQESELISLKSSNAWFEKWTITEEIGSSEDCLRDHINSLRCSLQMAQADKESRTFQLSFEMTQKIDAMRHQETVLKDLCRKEKLEKEFERVARLDLLEKLKLCQLNLATKTEELSVMNSKSLFFQEKSNEFESKAKDGARFNEQLTNMLHAKEKEAESMRVLRMQDVEELNRQLLIAANEYSAKQSQVDDLRDETKSLKVIIFFKFI